MFFCIRVRKFWLTKKTSFNSHKLKIILFWSVSSNFKPNICSTYHSFACVCESAYFMKITWTSMKSPLTSSHQNLPCTESVLNLPSLHLQYLLSWMSSISLLAHLGTLHTNCESQKCCHFKLLPSHFNPLTVIPTWKHMLLSSDENLKSPQEMVITNCNFNQTLSC